MATQYEQFAVIDVLLVEGNMDEKIPIHLQNVDDEAACSCVTGF
jgi:hypothetical protein